jgi:hypothetical protein
MGNDQTAPKSLSDPTQATALMSRVEAIDALYAKATPDNWHERGRAGYIVKGPSFGPAKGMVAEFDCGNYANSKEEGTANAALTCALVNAWPQIREALLLSLSSSERPTQAISPALPHAQDAQEGDQVGASSISRSPE